MNITESPFQCLSRRNRKMLTVSTLLSNPLFQDFRIIAGRSGLDNAILSTGYFEWEQDSDIVRSFGKSEFVITTLYAAQNDIGFAEKCLKLLINNHVAAIAIKDVYYQDLSDEIKNYADEHNVPILVFSNTYIDDIIVTIHNGLTGSLSASHSNSVLDQIIFDASLTAQDREGLMRRLNSFLCSSTIFAAYISEDIDTPNLTAASISQYEAIYDVIKNDVPREIDGTVFVPLFAAYKMRTTIARFKRYCPTQATILRFCWIHCWFLSLMAEIWI
ncbi:hypothetical protein D3Z38_16390 [Clostridiales bacterium]|nr:hypothetical protein [Clostridiales bacterium]